MKADAAHARRINAGEMLELLTEYHSKQRIKSVSRL